MSNPLCHRHDPARTEAGSPPAGETAAPDGPSQAAEAADPTVSCAASRVEVTT